MANLTSVAQFFLLGGWQSAKVRKILGIENDDSTRQQLIGKLREYKGSPSKDAFEDLMSLMKC